MKVVFLQKDDSVDTKETTVDMILTFQEQVVPQGWSQRLMPRLRKDSKVGKSQKLNHIH